MRLFPPALVPLGALLLLGCAGAASLPRKKDGQTYEGRRIPALAYAWYARGLRHERAGELSAAQDAYEQALAADPESGSAWAALGRCTCRDSHEQALAVFEEGLARAAEQAPVYVERGFCELGTGRTAQALADAERAVQKAPDSSQATQLLAQVWAQQGEPVRARLVQLSFAQWAAVRGQPGPQAPAAQPALGQLDRAIRDGQQRNARALATGLVTPGALSLRYYALGQRDWAREQALLVLRAEPEQSDAELTRWLLAGDAASSAELAAPSKSPPPRLVQPLSTLGVLLFAERLAQLAGTEASRVFLAGMGPLALQDELERSVAARLPSLEPARAYF